MSGYADTKKLIEDTLVGRPAGTMIYPEGHQAIDMSLLDYIHSVELLGASELQGIATTSTVPVQPDNAKVSYIATVPAGQTYVFTNFHDQNGNSISITTGANTVSLLTFLWNGEYWQVQNSQIQLMLNITAGYLYAGIAIPTTNPGSPDEPVFYIAAQAGTYTNFGGIVVNDGEAAILKYVNSSWVKEVSGLATREEVSRLGQYVGLWCYFTGDNLPSIGISGTTVSVVFPSSGALNIYSGTHTRIFQITCTGQSFTLNNLNRLVVNSDGTMSVIDNDNTGSYVVLVSNKYGRIGGLLADYYYNREINDVKDQVNTYMWWSGGGDPVISISGETVYVTFPAGKYWNIKRKDGSFIEMGISAGNGQTFTVESYKVLIFDKSDRVVKVVNNDSAALKNCYVFLMNVRGKYFTGLLEPFFDNAAKTETEDIDCYLYWQNGGMPTFLKEDSSAVKIIFPNSNFHIYKKNGGMAVSSSTSGKGQTFTVSLNQVLVYDKSDNTVKVSGIGTNYPNGCFILFTNILGYTYTGLIAEYYYAKKAYNEGNSAYFIGLQYPEFWIKGTSIFITMPTQGIRIYSSDNGVTRQLTAGIGETYEVTNLSKLVFDFADNTLKVVGNDVSGNFYNILTNNNLVVSGLAAPYYTQYQNSIAHLYDTQDEKLILQNIKKTNSTIHGAAGYTPLLLLHFSDLHGRPENLKRIMQYYDMFASKTVGGSQVAVIDDILNTGDTINFSTDSYDFYSNIPGAEKILTAIGNHEYTPPQGGSDPSQLEVYSKEIAPFISNWGVTQPANAAQDGLCYYYKDYANAGVRLIVLDDFAANMSNQVSWFENVLADAKTNDLAVVCAIHYPANMNYLKNISFCSIDARDGMIYVVPTEMLNAVDTFINGGGEFVCWLTGHTHEDMFGTIIDHTNQVCVTVSDAGWDGESGSCVREVGTKSQDCFNLFSADRNTKCLKLHRVGVDRDRYMRHIGELCYNYETKSVVYND